MECAYRSAHHRVHQVKTCAPVADCVQEPTNRPLHSIFKVLTNEGNVRWFSITLLPMVRLPQNPNAKSHPRWYTSHASLTNETLEAQRQRALRRSEAIQFPPATIQKFKADEILSLREGVFFVPVLESQEALDAFLLLHGTLYILQFTVGQNHDIKPGFVKFLQKCQNVPPLEEWKFVFLTWYDVAMSRAEI